MELYDGNGNKITLNNEATVTITPANTTFFDVEYPRYANLYDGSYEVGGINSNGTVNTAQTSCFVTDYLELSDGLYLYPGTRTELTVNPEEKASVKLGCTFLTFYNTNKALVGSRITSPSAPVEIPENAVYCRVSWQPYSMTDLDTSGYFVGVVSSANEAPAWERYYAPGEIKSARVKHENLTFRDKPLTEGKTWVLFGDSITEAYAGTDWQGNGFASRIAREFGLTIDNRGKSGSNICSGTTDYPNVTGIIMLDAFLAEIEAGTTAQPDYITIAFGANCWEEYVGTAEDTSANTDKSYYGATKYFIEKLREKCPNSVFGFVLAHEVDWTGVKDTKQVGVPMGREAMKAVCEEYRVPYINMYTDSGITADMLNDGVHINTEQSANLYYHAMRRFVMGL